MGSIRELISTGQKDSDFLMFRQISYRIFSSKLSSMASRKSGKEAIIHIKGVIFDLDGTLTLPVLNFTELRRRLGCPPPPYDLLEFVRQQPEKQKIRLYQIIEDFEEEGNRNMKLQPGVRQLLKFLASQGLHRAIVTRNAQPCVDYLLDVLGDPESYGGPFTHMLTRDFKPTKPDPAPVQYICRQWGIPPSQAIMVGDHLHDIQSGNTAGAVTILVNNKKNGAYKKESDFNVDLLEGIINLLKNSPFTVNRSPSAPPAPIEGS
ncbi:predicted protein [Nematostella vectensis]|uniref:Uncharacterized protein n=1 Tax=Nematostella vectensis TaxID=45351 RepID=A7RSE1_NEMVE|nr:uncharacterized hydrolase YOR131C [Nematostella vectensis]XP_032217981.1 uncharacterized hydrolase YOR131C [Nematostella vectensis]EDO45548.1 predicted protein [Nematostella vectensis]|eukprot:XP_001637611.1 predicted protein [Nematostella vectensis]